MVGCGFRTVQIYRKFVTIRVSAFIISICKWGRSNVKERDYMCLFRIAVAHRIERRKGRHPANDGERGRERKRKMNPTFERGKLSNKVFNGIRYRKSKWSLHCEIIAYFHLHMSKLYELKEVKTFDFMRCKQLKMPLRFSHVAWRGDRDSHTHTHTRHAHRKL